MAARLVFLAVLLRGNSPAVSVRRHCVQVARPFFTGQETANVEDQLRILRRMLEAAEAADKDSVLRLNKDFDKIHLQEKAHMVQDLSLELDRCRQSCVGAVTMPGLHNVFLKDARARLSDLDDQGGK